MALRCCLVRAQSGHRGHRRKSSVLLLRTLGQTLRRAQEMVSQREGGAGSAGCHSRPRPPARPGRAESGALWPGRWQQAAQGRGGWGLGSTPTPPPPGSGITTGLRCQSRKRNSFLSGTQAGSGRLGCSLAPAYAMSPGDADLRYPDRKLAGPPKRNLWDRQGETGDG